MEREKKKLAEAALFMSTEPITVSELARVMGVGVQDGVRTVDELVREFNSRDSALKIVRTGEGYRMQVRQEFLPRVKHLAASVDLPKSVLRTLSVIAFKQPIKQSVVAKLRGNKAYEHVRELAGRGFIRKTKQGHTFVLETTRKFNEYFQLPGNVSVSQIASGEIQLGVTQPASRGDQRALP